MVQPLASVEWEAPAAGGADSAPCEADRLLCGSVSVASPDRCQKKLKIKKQKSTYGLLPLSLHQGFDDRCDSEEAQRNIHPDFDDDLRFSHWKPSDHAGAIRWGCVSRPIERISRRSRVHRPTSDVLESSSVAPSRPEGRHYISGSSNLPDFSGGSGLGMRLIHSNGCFAKAVSFGVAVLCAYPFTSCRKLTNTPSCCRTYRTSCRCHSAPA
jgi:hypothetical protein